MTANLQRLQRRIARAPLNRRGRRQYDKELRTEIASYARERRTQGESYAYIARTLGVPSATLLHWREEGPVKSKRRKRSVGFRPVALQEQEHGLSDRPAISNQTDSRTGANDGPIVVLPGGVRIEGVAVTELPALVRDLICLP